MLWAFQEKATVEDDFGDSDEEQAPDAYLARVKAEGKERDAGMLRKPYLFFKNGLIDNLCRS